MGLNALGSQWIMRQDGTWSRLRDMTPVTGNQSLDAVVTIITNDAQVIRVDNVLCRTLSCEDWRVVRCKAHEMRVP